MSTVSSDAAEAKTQGGVPDGWKRLDSAVVRLLVAYETWRKRAEDAEARVARLETTLRGISKPSESDPVDLSQELEALRSENEDLRRRLGDAAELVRRNLRRLDFVEDAP